MNTPIGTQRRLAAIFAADVEGYSRLMGTDEVGTLLGLTERRALLDGLIASYRGRIANTAGDSVLAEFSSAVDAVQCAVEAQDVLERANTGEAPDLHINFRIGVHVGDVMVKGGDLFGDGVNIAARLQTFAAPGGVLVSGAVYDYVRKVLPFVFTDIGAQQFKNIEESVRTYAVRAAKTPPDPENTEVSNERQPRALPEKPSIAVLPFQNMSGDTEQEYFADGMVEEITTALSRFNFLFVIARNSSFTYKGKAVDIKQVGRELGVRYVLEGSVRKAGGRVRITGQLIEATTGAHLWADKFEGLLDDVFDLQDRLASSVVGVVAPKIERAEVERATRKPTENLEAYDWHLRGIAAFGRWTRDGTEDAIRMFQKALELDPNYASAMAWIGGTYSMRAMQGWMVDPNKEAAEAIRYARLSQELGRNDAHALVANANTIALLTGDLDTASSSAGRALSLNPNLAYGWQINGWLNVFLGHHQLAIEQLTRALQLNPFDALNAATMNGLAWAYFLIGDIEKAHRWAQEALAENPLYLQSLRVNAAVDAALGQLPRARNMADRILELNPSEKTSNILIVRITRKSEDREKVVKFLRIAGIPE